MLVLAATFALIPVGAVHAGKPTASRASAVLVRKVQSRYRRETRERLIAAKCRRRTKHEYYCLYGIHANRHDGVTNPDGGRWVYSGVGYVEIRADGRLVADPLRPRRGADFAPY